MNPQLINDLKAVRKRLEDYGWCQGTTQNKVGEHCLAGAVMFGVDAAPSSKNSSSNGDAVIAALSTTLRNKLPLGTFKGIVSWNDTKGRSKEQVFELIDETIERVKNA